MFPVLIEAEVMRWLDPTDSAVHAHVDRSWRAVEVASGLPRVRQREVLHVPVGVGQGAVPLERTPLRAGRRLEALQRTRALECA
jgi:hypothetical protein